MNTETQIIEINGVKMEIDMRHAKVVHQNLRVGSKVKILSKSAYGGPEVYPGVIVGFEPFTDLPTIIVAYIKSSYSSAELQFAYINSKSADKWDLVPCVDDELPVSKTDVIAVFERDIQKSRNTIAELEGKRDFFVKHFNEFFTEAERA